MSSISKELAELLVDNGLLSDADLEQVEQEKQKTGEPLRIILERLNLASEKQLKNTLELQYGVNYLALHTINPELPVVDLLPAEVIQTHKVVPIHIDGNRLTVAMVNPDDSAAMSVVKANITYDVKPLVCFEDDFQIFLDQIEKMRHMPVRQVSAVDDSEFGLETAAAEVGIADDTTGEIIEELPSEEFQLSEDIEEAPPSEHEAADIEDFQQSEEEIAAQDMGNDEVTSDTVTAATSQTSGTYSAQYDTGSLDAIATPNITANELTSEPNSGFDPSQLDSIPTPNFDASALDSIPTPKAEAGEPPEKPQPGGISSFFKGGGSAPKKAASEPAQERSGGLSALRGMMGGKKGGKKNEPAARPATPPPPPPRPVTPPPAPQSTPSAEIASSHDDTAGGADEPQGKSGLLSSKLGSAAHHLSGAKKFLKEKRTDSQPIAPQETKEEIIPEWMNQIDENTPIVEQNSGVAEEKDLSATEEQAVNDYYAEFGFDPTAEDSSPEVSLGDKPEISGEPELASAAPEQTTQEASANYEVPPMDPGGANFMSWTDNSESEGQAVSDALAEASEALAASNAAVEEALANAEEAWEEASAAAEEAVAAGDISSDDLPAFEQTETPEILPEVNESEAATEPVPAIAEQELTAENMQEEAVAEGTAALEEIAQQVAEEISEEEPAAEINQEVSAPEEAAQEELVLNAVSQEQTEAVAPLEVSPEEAQPPVQEVASAEETEAPEAVLESAISPKPESSEDTAALLDEMATLADTLEDDASPQVAAEAAQPETVEEEQVQPVQESVSDMPDDSEFADLEESSNVPEPNSVPAVAESVTEVQAETLTAPAAEETQIAAETQQSIAAAADEFNLDDSEFLSGVEELQAMAELSFNEPDAAKQAVDEFAGITDWGDEAPSVGNLMSNLSSAAGEEKPVEEAKESLEAPPFLQEDLLLEMGVITADQIPAIRRECLTTGQSLSVVLERMGIAGEMELSDAFDMQFGAGYVSLAAMTIETEILNILPAKTVEQRKVLPVGKSGNKVIVAMVNPDDLAAMNDIKFRLKGIEIKKAVCLEDDFEHFLRTHLVQSNGEPHFEGATPKTSEDSTSSNGASPPQSSAVSPPAVQDNIEPALVVEESSMPAAEVSVQEQVATPPPVETQALPVAASEPEPPAPVQAPPPAPAPAPTPALPSPPAAPDPAAIPAPVAPASLPAPTATPAPTPVASPVTPPPVIHPSAIPSAPIAPVAQPTPPPAPPAPSPVPAVPPGVAALAKPPQPPAQASAPPVINPASVPQSAPTTPAVAPGTPAAPSRPLLQQTLHEIPAQRPPGAPSPTAPTATTPAASPTLTPPVLPAGVIPPKPISPQQIPNFANQPRVSVPPATVPAVQPPTPPVATTPPSAVAPQAPGTVAPAPPQSPAPTPPRPPGQAPGQSSGQTPRIQPAGLAAPPAPQAPGAPAVTPAAPVTPQVAPQAAPAPLAQPAVVQPVPPTPTSVTPPPAPPAPPPQPAILSPMPTSPAQPTTAAPPVPAAANPVPPNPVPSPAVAPPVNPQVPAPPAAIATPHSPAGAPAVIPPAPPGAPLPVPRINPNQIPGVRAQQQSSGSIPVVPAQTTPSVAPAVPPAAPAPAPQVSVPAAAPPAPPAAPAAPSNPSAPNLPPGPPPLDPNLLSLARDIINKAADNGFSDVHIEPQATEMELRYWYDGALIESTKLEKHIHSELLRCYKSIAGLSPEETKKPQDKRLKWTDTGAELDIRITTIPSEHGEMVAVSIKFDDEE